MLRTGAAAGWRGFLRRRGFGPLGSEAPWAPARPMSSASSSSSAGKAALVGGVAALSLAGGTLGYAGMDTEFRKYVADSVPGAKDVFDTILGPPEAPPQPSPVVPSKLKPPKKAPSATPAGNVGEVKVEAVKVDAAAPAAPEITAVPEAPRAKESRPEMEPQPEAPTTDHPPVVQSRDHDQTPQAPSAMETKVKVLQMEESVQAALLAGEKCLAGLEEPFRLLMKTDDYDDEVELKKAFEASLEGRPHRQLLEAAEFGLAEAEDRIRSVRHDPGPNQADTDPRVDRALMVADSVRMCLDKADSLLLSLEALVASRAKVRRDLAMEDVGVLRGLDEKQMDRIADFVFWRTQRELIRAKLQGGPAAPAAADASTGDNKSVLEALRTEHERRLALVTEEVRREATSAMRQQLEVHLDHLRAAKDAQEAELRRSFKRELDDALTAERSSHRRKVADLDGRLQGLREAARESAKVPAEVSRAQDLWLACRALRHGLDLGGAAGPLAPEVEAIRKALGEAEEPFVRAVLGSLPASALERGVSGEESLRDRFFRVERTARRTALIGPEGASLFRYAVSFLQSLVATTPSTASMPDKDTNEVDPDSISTYEVLWLARGSLERGDLEMTVKYMTLLRGLPRKVAQDWIEEARVLLTARQACDALLAHAAALGLEVLPQP